MISTSHSATSKKCACSGDSGCGCSSCESVSDTGFSRPNFFAGQLLTDEDLRDTVNYFVEKNRLHNRHFLGEGVVCGLQVLPHPCAEDRNKVIVQKGHAINGCGDDILVTRKQEVDILEKVRGLLSKSKGGSDCGDPCSKADSLRSKIGMLRKDWAVAQSSSEREKLEDRMQELKSQLESSQLATTPAKYGLYVRYAERLTDLVSPYQTDDVNNTSCQASRIRESYSFELRCAEGRQYDDLRKRLDACGDVVHNYKVLQGKTLHGISTLEMVQKILTQFDAIEKAFTQPPLNTAPLNDLSDAQLDAMKARGYWPEALKSANYTDLRSQTIIDLQSKIAKTVSAWIEDRLKGSIAEPETPFLRLSDDQLKEFLTISFLPSSITTLTVVQLKALARDQFQQQLPSGFNFQTECLKNISIEFAIALKVDLANDINKALSVAIATNGPLSNESIPADTSQTKPLTIVNQRTATQAMHSLLTLAIRAILFNPDFTITTLKPDLTSIQKLLMDKLPLLKHVKRLGIADPISVPEPVIDLLISRNATLKSALEGNDIGRGLNVRSVVVGEILESGVVKKVFASLDAVNESLLGFVAAGEVSLTPELRSLMFGVDLSSFNADSHLVDASMFFQIRSQAKVVNRAVAEVVRLCMCNALLPPCPVENDSAVLLAEITVENCEVTDICNLSRRMVVTGPSLRYWFSDFSGLLDGLRDSCCPSNDSISKLENEERNRLESLKGDWLDEATVTVTTKEQFVPLLVGSGNQADRLGQVKEWDTLSASGVEVLGQIAVSPSKLALDLFAFVKDGKLDQQSLNIALAKLSGRPETDVRNLLAWSEQFGSPAEVRTIAVEAKATADSIRGAVTEAKTEAGEAKTTAGEAQTTAGEAQTTAGEAKTTAGEAKTTAGEAKTAAGEAKTAAGEAKTAAGEAKTTAGEAKTTAGEAKTTAGEAKTTAGEAKTTAGEAKTTAGEAKTTAGEAKTTAGEAKTTAGEAKTTAGEAKTTAGEAKTTAGEAKAAAGEAKDDARFDFVDNLTTTKKTLQQAVDELRAGNLGSILNIQKSVKDIIGPLP